MNKNLIKKRYKEKIELINYYNKKYFDENKPVINDSEYDELKVEILNLEKKYIFLKDKNSPSFNVGFKPSKIFKKFIHKVPMLSLANAFSEEDLLNFEKRIKNYLDKKSDIDI